MGKRSQVCGQRWYNHLAETAPHVKRVEPTGKVPRGMIYKEGKRFGSLSASVELALTLLCPIHRSRQLRF